MARLVKPRLYFSTFAGWVWTWPDDWSPTLAELAAINAWCEYMDAQR